MEFLYKLDLPPLTSVIREDIKDTFFTEFFKRRVSSYDSSDILKEEFLNLKNLEWHKVILFLKTPNSPGVVHKDNPFGDERLHANILWVHGNGGIKYWDSDKIISENPAIDIHSNLPMTGFEVDKTPTKDYKTTSGSVYLLNASVAHTGYNDAYETENRYSIALRYRVRQNLSWNALVDLFSDLIID
jgi:hypothetical protein